MSQYSQEPPQDVPPFWSAPSPSEASKEQEMPLVMLPLPRHLRRKLRTQQEVEEAVATRNLAVIPKLAEALGHRDPGVALAASNGLRAFGEAGFEALERAALDGKGNQQERAIIALGQWGDPRATPVLLRAVAQEKQQRETRSALAIVAGVLCTPLAFLWFAGQGHRSTLLRERVAEALGQIGDVRAIPMLAEMAKGRSTLLSEMAGAALMQILPLVDSIPAGSIDLFVPELVPALAGLLSHSNRSLVRQSLRALWAVGDGRAIPAVQRLAARRFSFKDERAEIADEALDLLTVLLERAAQEEQRAMLLRAASAPQASPAELLRPAQGHADAGTAPNQLLRPSTAETEPEDGNDARNDT